MAEISLITWLRALQDSELETFLAQLRHDPAHANTLPFRLLEWLKEHLSAWGAEQAAPLPEAEIFQHLYPGQPFKSQRLRRVFMDLKALVEDFVTRIAKPPIPAHLDRELRLLQFLLNRGSYKLFLRKVEQFDLHLRTVEELAPSTFLAKAWLEEMRSQYFIHHHMPEDSFQDLSEALEEFYLSFKVEKMIAMRAREAFAPQKHVYFFPDELKSMLSAPLVEDWPLVRLWKAVLALEELPPQESAYLNMVHVLEQVKARIPSLTLRQIRGSMFNHLSRAQDLGSRAYYGRLWGLLNEMLVEGTLFLDNHALSMPFFLVTVRAGCLSGRADWVERFMLENKQYLFGDGHEELLQYCELLTAFHAGRKPQAWRDLLRLRPKDLRLDAFSRILQVQLAYDLDKDDEFLRLVESLDKFILRCAPLGQRFMSLATEFARLAERLGKAKFGGKALPKALANAVESADSAEKLWLKEKIAEFQ